MKKLDTEQFIEKANKIHNNKYDYSKTEYINSREKVCIICHKKDENGIEHGEFWQKANNHLNGQDCPKCAKRGRKKLNLSDFIQKSKIIHNNKYDYSKFTYSGSQKKGIIICPIHGEFLQNPNSHLLGTGCPKCGKESMANKSRKPLEQFIEGARKVHGNKYDYSRVQYKNNKEKIEIICPIHGSFLQTPQHHLKGCGCPKCAGRDNTTEDFLRKAKQVHGDKYDYSQTNYVDYKTPVNIICKEHGQFYQLPNVHLHGSGCPVCNFSKGEQFIKNLLDKNNIKYIDQYKIDNKKYWNTIIRVDFVIYNNNKQFFIEYNGVQHYMPVKHFGGELRFQNQQKRDSQLRLYCEDFNIPLLEIKYDVILDNSLASQILKFIEYEF